MWEIRITNVSDLNIQSLCKSIGGNSIAVREGDPYDTGIAPHCHIYTIPTKSESYIRKQIQQLDVNRKGNALYSMAKSHDNTPNYVLKKVYDDTQGRFRETMEHPRVIYKTENFLELNYGQWYIQYEKYLNGLKHDKAIRKRIKKNSTMEMIIEISDKHKEASPPDPNWFIPDVIQWHRERDLILPSRSNMERYIITIYQNIQGDPQCLNAYYSINFYRNN